MPLQLKIAGADFSASALPKFEKRIGGLPTEALHLLWLFENGAGGAAMSLALDSSDNGHHGSLFAGSTAPKKGSHGVYSSGSEQFYYAAPGWPTKRFSSAFTAIVVAKSGAAPAAAAAYPTCYTGSGNIPGGVMPVTGSQGGTVKEALSLLIPTTGGSPLGGNKLDLAYFSATGVGSGQTNQRISGGQPAGATCNDWFAAAFSYDPATNGLIAAPPSGVVTTATHNTAATVEDAVSDHLFGWSKYLSTDMAPLGELGLVAMYDVALGATDLVRVKELAKARVASRGVTVF
jgi:hypothetical protein